MRACVCNPGVTFSLVLENVCMILQSCDLLNLSQPLTDGFTSRDSTSHLQVAQSPQTALPLLPSLYLEEEKGQYFDAEQLRLSSQEGCIAAVEGK